MEHRTKTLAHTRNARIDQCTCGAVHLTVGGTTLRVPEAVARELKDALVASMATIDRSVSAPAPSAQAMGGQKVRFRVVLPEDDEPDEPIH